MIITLDIYEPARGRWTKEFTVECLGCSTRGPVARTSAAAWDAAVESGWRLVVADIHECAECAGAKRRAA